MQNTLAVIGDTIKSIVPIQPRLPWASLGAATSYTSVYMPEGMTHFGTGANGQGAQYDCDKLAGDPMGNSVVAACVLAYAKAISQAPPILQNRKGGKWVDVTDHDALDLLLSPNKDLDLFDIDYATAAWKLTRGQAPWVVFFDKGRTRPIEIWPWKPERVRPLGTASEFISGYEVESETGGITQMAREQVIHFRYMPNLENMRTGWTPLSTGNRQLTGFAAAAQYHTAILLNAGVMSMLISIKQGDAQGREIEVTPAMMQGEIDKWRRRFMGNKSASGGIEGTNLPLEVTKMAWSPDEMSVDKLLFIFERHICALMDIDPAIARFAGGSAEIPYSNLETIERAFWQRSILPMKAKDASTLTRQYLPLWFKESEVKDWRVAYDFSKVQALQENQEQIHKMWLEDFKGGGVDLHTFQTRIGLSDVPEEYKGRFAGPQAAPETDAESEVKAVRGWQTQPRDDVGRWTDGAGNLNAAHVLTVMRAEGIHESRHGEVLGKIKDGTLKTRESVLAQIDAVRTARTLPPRNGAVVDVAPDAEPRVVKGSGRTFHDFVSFAEPETEKHLRPVLDAIARVHGIKAIADVKVSGKSSEAGGSYNCRTSEVTANLIDSGGVGFGAKMAFAHELGHLLDHRVIAGGDPADPGSDGQPTGFASYQGQVTPEMANVLDAARNSPSYKAIQGNKKVFASYRNYLTEPHEVFARAYAQYVAVRSGDADLISEVAQANAKPKKGGKDFIAIQWEAAEFEPIAQAMDALFSKQGLLKND